MAADYLIASLPALAFDAPPPCSMEAFLAQCRDQLGNAAADELAALANGVAPQSPTPIAQAWLDLDARLRNAAAAERARAAGRDASKWLRPASGCSIFWSARISAAFQEKDPAKRDRALDLARWDAAGELVPPHAPLSKAAAYAYAIRLAISIRRAAISQDAGNQVFNRLTRASSPEAILKEVQS